MRTILDAIYRGLGVLASLSLLSAFVCITLGVVARKMVWDIQGLDAYAGFAIAAALFLALPTTFQRDELIRVSLILERVPTRWRSAMQAGCLTVATVLTLYFSWFSARLVWISYVTVDISPGLDATPLWVPQLAMAVGAAGFALAMLDALMSHFTGAVFFRDSGQEAMRSE